MGATVHSAFADARGFGEEVGHFAGVDFLLADAAARQQFLAARFELARQLGQERPRFRSQDLGLDLHAEGCGSSHGDHSISRLNRPAHAARTKRTTWPRRTTWFVRRFDEMRSTDMRPETGRRSQHAHSKRIRNDKTLAHRRALDGHQAALQQRGCRAKLRGSIQVEHTLARLGAERLWWLLHHEPYVPALGALTGNQAVQQVKAGLKAIYLSGWQVAADANDAGQMYPDQSLYPADSVPNVVRSINNSLMRADQIHHMDGKNGIYWFAPIVADAEAGFGGTLNAFELMKAMIEAGAACVHFEDQLSSAKKCGHLGGKVLVPTSEAIQKLVAARLAADVLGVPTLIMARTDADSAHLLTSDIDPRDREFLTGERTAEGFFRIRGGLESAIARGLAYAPYADLIWCETSEPESGRSTPLRGSDPRQVSRQMLAYNCSPSFNWKKKLDDRDDRQLPVGTGRRWDTSSSLSRWRDSML